MSSLLQGLPRLPVTDNPEWAGWFSVAHSILQDVSNAGPTTNRPTTVMYVGKTYFDTTLGKPIWLKSGPPAVWVDATGAAV